ncbi:hypothetical protein HDV00_011634 [Rhizophlyctis rosea]|nr:hypothetical protein HDV00_011634 [Rhizophlyctis rosea]
MLKHLLPILSLLLGTTLAQPGLISPYGPLTPLPPPFQPLGCYTLAGSLIGVQDDSPIVEYSGGYYVTASSCHISCNNTARAWDYFAVTYILVPGGGAVCLCATPVGAQSFVKTDDARCNLTSVDTLSVGGDGVYAVYAMEYAPLKGLPTPTAASATTPAVTTTTITTTTTTTTTTTAPTTTTTPPRNVGCFSIANHQEGPSYAGNTNTNATGCASLCTLFESRIPYVLLRADSNGVPYCACAELVTVQNFTRLPDTQCESTCGGEPCGSAKTGAWNVYALPSAPSGTIPPATTTTTTMTSTTTSTTTTATTTTTTTTATTTTTKKTKPTPTRRPRRTHRPHHNDDGDDEEDEDN